MATVNITIKASGGQKIVIEGVDPAETTGLQLKELIKEKNAVDVDAQQLIYTGQVLKNDRTLASYNIAKDCGIHFVHNKKKSGPAAGDASASSSTVGAPAGVAAAAPSSATSTAAPTPAGSAAAGATAASAGTSSSTPMTAAEEAQARMLVTQLSQNPEVVQRILQQFPSLLDENVVREFIANPQSVLESPESMRRLTELLINSSQPTLVVTREELSAIFTRVLTKLSIDVSQPLTFGGTDTAAKEAEETKTPSGSDSNATESTAVAAPTGGNVDVSMDAATPAAATGADADESMAGSDDGDADMAGGADEEKDVATPEQEAQLEQLAGMGFVNRALNLNILNTTGGNVEDAIAMLLGMQ
jgi:hypothetical protein